MRWVSPKRNFSTNNCDLNGSVRSDCEVLAADSLPARLKVFNFKSQHLDFSYLIFS